MTHRWRRVLLTGAGGNLGRNLRESLGDVNRYGLAFRYSAAARSSSMPSAELFGTPKRFGIRAGRVTPYPGGRVVLSLAALAGKGRAVTFEDVRPLTPLTLATQITRELAAMIPRGEVP